MNFQEINQKINNKIWAFNDESFKIKFLQIENSLKWLKFSFKNAPSNTYLIIFEKLLQQIYQVEDAFKSTNKVEIEETLYKILQERHNERELNESKRKIKTKLRNIIIQNIPTKELGPIVSNHINEFKNNIKKTQRVLNQTDPNEIHDLYGLSFLNSAFSSFGMSIDKKQDDVIILEDFLAGFYTNNKYDINQNSTVWNKAINPISWFGVKMNDGSDVTTDYIQIAKNKSDFDKRNVPFVGVEI